MSTQNIKKIPVGVDSFEDIMQENYYYVDKTGFVQDIIDKSALVTLITRPRRFGKTINMLMLKSFFEISDIPKRSFFESLYIGQHGDCMEHQGKYPVIFFTFGSIKVKTAEEFQEKIRELIAREFVRHLYLLNSSALDAIEKNNYMAILNGTITSSLYNGALYTLTNILHKHHGIRPFVLIDEYDAPLLEAYTSKDQDYYNAAVGFMRTFLTDGLKTNHAFHKAVITGVTRIAKESLFSGFNNASPHPVTDTFYASRFGFTEQEVRDLVAYYNPPVTLEQIRHWYDGYTMGKSGHIYNPWSILNMLFKNGNLDQYWVNAGNNDLIKDVIAARATELQNDLELLINGHTVRKKIIENTTFETLHTHPDAAWNLLLTGGFLSCKNLADRVADFYIPNQEIREFFIDTIMTWCRQHVNTKNFTSMLEALTQGDARRFEDFFINFVEHSFSFRDIGGDEPEKFYHAFVFGLFASLYGEYQVLSNREGGSGIYDLAIIPKDTNKFGIVIEFKRLAALERPTVDSIADYALEQALRLDYVEALRGRGIKNILTLGIAFKGKQVAIRYA